MERILPASRGKRTVGAFLAVAVALCACGKKSDDKGAGAAKQPTPVRVASVVEKSMPVQLSTFGMVEAYSTIMVKAQVSGEVTKVWFNEGDDVTKDQVLFTIDTRPYEVALQQAEANLAKAEALAEQAHANVAKDKAQAANAQVELDRAEALLPKKMVSQEEYDKSRANAEAFRASVSADEAAAKSAVEAIRGAKVAIDDAKLNLDYCTIRSPIDGKTGSLLLHQGNIVKANDTGPMVTINQLCPIYVSFILPEKNLAVVREFMGKGPLEVTAVIPNEEDKPIAGRLTFIDNAVQNTGTIRLKATFDNEDRRLWPGQFVNVILQVTVRENVIATPAEAIQTGQSGSYVYVVKEDMTAELRNIVIADTVGDMVVVKEGLARDEKVVTDGQLRLTPGGTVKIVSDPAAEGNRKS